MALDLEVGISNVTTDRQLGNLQALTSKVLQSMQRSTSRTPGSII